MMNQHHASYSGTKGCRNRANGETIRFFVKVAQVAKTLVILIYLTEKNTFIFLNNTYPPKITDPMFWFSKNKRVEKPNELIIQSMPTVHEAQSRPLP